MPLWALRGTSGPIAARRRFASGSRPPASRRGLFAPRGGSENCIGPWNRNRSRNGFCALPKPIGLMACNDDRGREVLEACRAAQIEVPEEIAVIGIDNDSLLCDLASPPLSSVALNAEHAGFEAAELLEKLMSGRVSAPQRIMVDPLYIVNRHSTNVVAVDDADVATAMRFIRDHCGQPVRVHDVADAVGLSRRMLEIRFRAALGRSLNDEIQRAHLEMAKRLLTETDWPMEKIALASGYNGASYLSVLFQRFLKLNPTEYRRRVRSI